MKVSGPFRLGLTGSIAMGKSTTASMFRKLGVPVHDADATVHRLYEGEAALLIEDAFPGTTGPKGVDRQKLSKAVLKNADDMKRLEAIVHPLVHREEQEFLEQAAKDGEPVVVLDIPLLFETGGENRVDAVMVVSASPAEQRRRVLAREGMDEERFEAILARQVPDKEKRRRADYVITTDKGLDYAFEQVRDVLEKLRAKHTSHGGDQGLV